MFKKIGNTKEVFSTFANNPDFLIIVYLKKIDVKSFIIITNVPSSRE